MKSFWSFTKRRMAKFNRLNGEVFHLHLKESAWRWHNREQIYDIFLKKLKEKHSKVP